MIRKTNSIRMALVRVLITQVIQPEGFGVEEETSREFRRNVKGMSRYTFGGVYHDGRLTVFRGSTRGKSISCSVTSVLRKDGVTTSQ